MVKHKKLRAHLDMWMTDTCNRYFHVLKDLGVVDNTKATAAQQQVLKGRNEMLDRHLPDFVDATLKMLDEDPDVERPKSS